MSGFFPDAAVLEKLSDEYSLRLREKAMALVGEVADPTSVGFVRTIVPKGEFPTGLDGQEGCAFFNPKNRKIYVVVRSCDYVDPVVDDAHGQASKLLDMCLEDVLHFLANPQGRHGALPPPTSLLDTCRASCAVDDGGQLCCRAQVSIDTGEEIPELDSLDDVRQTMAG